MNKKNKLTIVVFLSLAITIVSFFIAGNITGCLLPYQDPPPELLKQYNEYVKTYTPVWYTMLIIFLVSLIAFIVSVIKLFIYLIKKDKNISER